MKRLSLLAWFLAAALGLTDFVRLAAAADEPAAGDASLRANTAGGGDAAQETKFIRLRRDDNRRPAAMETAVVHYASPARPGVTIDLVGAVHVGDRTYYDDLNKLFENYD